MKTFQMYEIPYFDTFCDYVKYLADTHGDKVGIVQFSRKGEREAHSYRDLGEDTFGLARMLRRDGFAGAHIGIVSESSYDYLVAFLAINCAGAVAVTIDTEQPDDTIRTLLRHADVTGVFASQTFLPICVPLLEDGTLKKLIPMGRNAEGETLRSLAALGRTMDDVLGDNLTPEMDSSIVFTSGTTNASKPVLLSQHNILVNATESVMIARGTQDLFSPLPLYHTYGLNSTVMGNMINGISITLNGDLKTMLRDMKLSEAKTLATVPLMIEAIYKGMMNGVAEAGMEDKVKSLMSINRFLGKIGLSFRKKDLLSIKEKAGFGNFDQFVVGGAHISRELSNDLKLLGITVLQGYGITECSPLISVNSMQSYAVGSVGHVVPSCQVKFVDDEILVKGPNVMQGYYKNPELTKEAFDEDGWFKTGDLGYIDKNGFLFINGRKKNLIVCKNGNKISPEMLEALIAPLPMVKEVMVSATTGGEGTDDVKVAASIVPDPKATAGMTNYEILDHLQKDIDAINKQLPTYQQIQMINIRDAEFEKTASSKIKRDIV